MLFHLLIDGIYLGEITPDPNLSQTSWDIQVSGGPKHLFRESFSRTPTQKNKTSPQKESHKIPMKGECHEVLIEPNGEISPFIRFELYIEPKKRYHKKVIRKRKALSSWWFQPS